MSIVDQVRPLMTKALKDLYGQEFKETDLTVSITKPEFEGDYTLVLFSFVKQLKKSPEQLGKEIGDLLLKDNPTLFTEYNVIKGFLNLTIADSYWTGFLQSNHTSKELGKLPAKNQNAQ